LNNYVIEEEDFEIVTSIPGYHDNSKLYGYNSVKNIMKDYFKKNTE